MPRNPENLPKADLVEELRDKHGIETIPVERELEHEEEVPVDATVVNAEDGVISEPIPLEEEQVTPELILEEYGGLLDTTTEEEREAAAAEAVEVENANAPSASEVAALYQPKPQAQPEPKNRTVALAQLAADERIPVAERIRTADRMLDLGLISEETRDAAVQLAEEAPE